MLTQPTDGPQRWTIAPYFNAQLTKGPGSVRVMAKTRLMGLGAFTFFAGLTGNGVPKRSPGLAALR
jgi:hypothetical protein